MPEPSSATAPVVPAEPAPRPLWHFLLAFLTLALLGLAFGEMAKAARRDEPDGLDLHVITWIKHHRQDWPALTLLFHTVTYLGNPELATPLTLLVAVILIVLGSHRIADLRKREAVFWLGVAISSRFLCILLKAWFERERPPVGFRAIVIDDDSFSFPSGHSVHAATFFSMLAILLNRLIPAGHPRLRFLAYAWCLVMAVLVGASRVWLIVHYPTDVIGGLLLGVGWVILAYSLRFGWRRWRHHQRRRARAGANAAPRAEGSFDRTE